MLAICAVSITERKQSEERLRRSEAFLAETRRLSSTGGVSKRMATGEVTWSEQVYRMFEFDQASARPDASELIATRVHPEDIPLMRRHDRASARRRQRL